MMSLLLQFYRKKNGAKGGFSPFLVYQEPALETDTLLNFNVSATCCIALSLVCLSAEALCTDS